MLHKPEEYIRRLRETSREIYLFGEKISDPYKNPVLMATVNAIAKTYELALNPEYKGILTVFEDEREVNRFLHVESSNEDLVNRVKMMRIVNRELGNCNYRCTGHDTINGLYPTTYEVDSKYNSDYHERLKRYLRYLQDNDLAVAGAMTDVKGDRSKRPGEQDDPDTYIHIVEERDDGIIVRGAKISISGASVSDELIVVPTRALRKGEEKFAVSFSVPANEKGVIFIPQWNSYDALRWLQKEYDISIDLGNINYGLRQTNMVIFDDVFIPMDRVFLKGEVEFAGKLVGYFTAHHRGGGAGCKGGFGDILLGATALMLDTNGLLNSRSIREKLAIMKYHIEAVYSHGISSAFEGYRHESGAYIPNPMLSNIAKLDAITHLKEAFMIAAELGGGIVVNAPSEKDIENPEVGEKIRKYLRGNIKYSAEDRIRAARILQSWVAGPHLVGLIQGGGPPTTQILSISAMMDLNDVIRLAKKLSGITGKE